MKRMKFLGYTLLIAILLICLIFSFTACDDNEIEDEEIVAGKDDLSMYEIYEREQEITIAKVKEEYRNDITKAIVPSNVTNVGHDAFNGCNNLEEVTICEGVIGIHPTAFYNLPKLKTVSLPNTLTILASGAFADCKELEEVNVPSSVIEIGRGAFENCIKLKNIVIGENTRVNVGAFDNTAWFNSQPDGMVYWGSLFYKYKGTMPSNTVIKIAEGTNRIAGRAFWGCDGLVEIVFPDSLEYMTAAIAEGCDNLKCITLGRSYKKSEVDNFWNMIIPVISSEGLKVIVPEGVEKIEEGFSSCYYYISSYELPVSIKRLESLFCLSYNSDDITYEVHYKGTIAQWNAIEKAFESPQYTVYCTDGAVIENGQ